MNDTDKLWEKFVSTGKIDDYIHFFNARDKYDKVGKESKNAISDNGDCTV